ncbi:class I SAM-dependent methyltransferase [Arthrobacter sp. Helios]|uniref:class I SAM-dependent methyltransferase n=1 Tax=Arthrobacter sp. Helios TaxID=2828862 RepID=UPI0020482619|nr:class I SAM-dependent methyltransferase [Arthrobacter sp. Helios]UPO78400.1 class I SAM-dependent methyltransferase [Arthrobacter sp. Helios]
MTSPHQNGSRQTPQHSQHSHQQSGHHNHQHGDESGLAEVLDLDALLLKEHLQEISEWTAAHQPNPATILDLGAGTGTGTLGLTRTFPAAQVVAVDQSEFMLQRVAAMMENQGLSDRVTTLQADLDTGWPQLSSIDLVWAASSMHHMSDPAHVFDRISRTLAPEGLLVVVEMDTLPRYLPDDLGFGTPGLEQRCHAAVAAAGWNSHPDWAPAIQHAGMTIAGQRTFAYATERKPELIAQNAQAFLSRMRTGLEDALSAEDLATLDQLLDPDGPQSLARRTDLSMRGSRTVWAARL